MSKMSDSEYRFLLAVANFRSSSDALWPDTTWLKEQLHLGAKSSSAITRAKNSLTKKGYLDSRFSGPVLSEDGKQLIESHPITIQSKVPILGTVKAGRIRNDDVLVEINDQDIYDEVNVQSIYIPKTPSDHRIFALSVIGDSMEQEKIYEGDFVFVEDFGGRRPKQNELIVTNYLSAEFEYLLESDNQFEPLEDMMVGPTLKYYNEQPDHIRLGWRRDFNLADSSNLIITKYIRPIGRVIGMYRSFP